MRPPLFIGQLALIRWAELINAIGKYANESRLVGFRHRLRRPQQRGCLRPSDGLRVNESERSREN